MLADAVKTDALQPEELRAVYQISRVILQAMDTASAFNQVVKLARPVFIFDNAVLYQRKADDALEPIYARSIGRGRSVEADMAWGEAIALEVVQTGAQILRCEEVGTKLDDRLLDRLRKRDFLGLPLWIGDELSGALVFIRFGGPEYLPTQIELACLIAEQVSQLLERQHMVEKIAHLEAERQLVRLQEEFVATVSHDLRSPLGFIKGYATSLLREDVEWDPVTRREFLTVIDDEADRLTDLIDNLLDSSRLRAGSLRMDFQPVRLEAILRDIAQRAKASGIVNEIVLALQSQPENIIISADPSRLVQVFDNLISNATKYAPDSKIEIRLQYEQQGAHIIFGDRGPGIPAEHLEDIFKRFYRLPEHHTTARGSGLGLFICREIIHAHQGKIYATSSPGQGTQMHVELNLSDEGQSLDPQISEVVP